MSVALCGVLAALASREDAVRNVLELALLAPRKPTSLSLPEESPAHPVEITDIFMFSKEADILEIRLYELWPEVSQFVIVEATHDHFGRSRNSVAPKLMRTARFRPYASKVRTVTVVIPANSSCRPGPKRSRYDTPGDGIWATECHQETAAARFIAQAKQGVFIFGHVDEIPSRQGVATLRAQLDSGLLTLPANFAIWFPWNLLTNSLHSDWPAQDVPASLGDPGVFPAGYTLDPRSGLLPRGRWPNVVKGGFHLSNYCYAPAHALKHLEATESQAGGDSWTSWLCGMSEKAIVDECSTMKVPPKHVAVAATEDLPRAFVDWPERYPALRGRVDPRIPFNWSVRCKTDF